jgi:hypothetical protein
MRKTLVNAADALTAASLAYLLVTMAPADLVGLPGLLVGIGVPLYVAHLVARIVTMRRATV